MQTPGETSRIRLMCPFNRYLPVFFLIWLAPGGISAETVINSVVASVDGEPITLYDLRGRLRPPRDISLQEAAADAEARRVLDDMILDRLVEAEAAARRVSVSDGEANALVKEVAGRNDLSVEQFAEALKGEGSSLDGFRRKVRGELLRQKLAASSAVLPSPVAIAQLPAHTLGQRPDIYSAEREVAAASFEVRGAQAQQFAIAANLDRVAAHAVDPGIADLGGHNGQGVAHRRDVGGEIR